jgi:hypothetical protein
MNLLANAGIGSQPGFLSENQSNPFMWALQNVILKFNFF